MDEPLALAILSTSRLVGRPWRTATSGGGWRRNGRAGAILRIDAFAVIAQAVSCLNHLVKNARLCGYLWPVAEEFNDNRLSLM